MNLPPLICSNCGRTYDLPAHLSHGPCIGCQTINCRPQAEGESLDKLQRATRLRLEGNHGEALKCYEHVLVDYDDEHSALWGKLLCQYGVEFVTDPKTGVRHATVHIPTSRPMQLHADFARACELAPEDVRAQYEADAAYVDEALAEINRHKESSPPYDVFICHKTTHLTGPGYTEDYNRGVQLTMLLTAQGYRVFFAPLAGLTPGASYEAGIYYALWSAKVMLLVSSDAAFLASPWVKSEWSRYLEMLDDGANKHLIPLMYDRLPDGRMPREIRLRGLQSIRMDSDLDAKDKLLAAMAKYTGKGTPAPVQPVVVQPVQTAAPAPKVEPVKEQPAPVAKAEPAKEQPVPVAKAEPVKPQPVVPASAPASDFDVTPVTGGVVIKKYTGSDVKLEIPAAIGGKPVLEIGEEAFEKCTTLAMVVIPEGVKKLGDYAFMDCSGLQSVRLPDSLENMGYSVFCNCSKLEELRIPAKVTAGARTVNWFLGCKKLKQITTAPGSQLQVRDGVLFNQSGCLVAYPMALPARSYTVPAGTKEIARRAFQGCSLEEIILPSGVTEVNYSAFADCAALKRLELPDSLRSIGDWAFESCGLPEVTIPEKTQVSNETFDRFRGLLRVYRDSPAHVLAVKKTLRHEVIGGTSAVLSGAAPAAPASDFDVTPVTGGVSITKYTGPGGEVVIPATLGGRPVVEIGKEAFERCTTLTKAVIPEGVKALGSYVFHGCSELQAVQLPASLERMDSLVFWDCAKLAEIRIPARVTADASTGNWFLGCSRLKKITTADGAKLQVRDGVLFTLTGCLVAYPMGLTARSYTVPEGTQKIGFKAFEGCSLEEIILPSSVTFINNCAFKNCTALKTMRLPEGLTEVRDSLFDGCRSLTSVNIPEKVERINAWAFDNCKALSTLTIPAGVKTIDGYAFQRCPALLRVHENSAAHKFAQEKGMRFEVIGASAPAEPVAPQRPRRPAISEIGAADSCYQVHPVIGGVSITKYTGPGGEVTIPATIGGKPVVEIGNGAFVKCTALTRVIIPEGVKRICMNAFFGCSSMRSVRIPDGVTEIDDSAFYDCTSLTIAEIPASVKNIGRSAFNGCHGLMSIWIPDGVMTIGDYAFFNCLGMRSARIPDSVKSIGDSAFGGCTSLRNLELPRKLPSIGTGAFTDCPLPMVQRLKLSLATMK